MKNIHIHIHTYKIIVNIKLNPVFKSLRNMNSIKMMNSLYLLYEYL